ncbi:MAG: hypothetical protein ACP5QA_10480 [Phycisphaerae bacterium]
MNIQKFLAMLEYDAFVALVPLVAQLLANIGKNNSPLGIAAAWTDFQVQVLAAVPNLKTEAIAALANLINSEMQKLLANAARNAGVSST